MSYYDRNDGDHEEKENHKSELAQRRHIVKLSRDDLEDEYLRLYEQNIILKKHGRKQEDKIKKMATKLIKLANDNKKLRETPNNNELLRGSNPTTAADLRLASKVEQLEMDLREVSRENRSLKDKLIVARQQLAVPSKKLPMSYSKTSSRIDTGRDNAIQRNVISAGNTPYAFRNDVLPRYGHSLLEEARAENEKLHDTIVIMEERIQDAEKEADILREQLRQKQFEKEEESMARAALINREEQAGITENIEIIKLQREIREKSTRFTNLSQQYEQLAEHLHSVKATNSSLLAEMERLNNELQAEHEANVKLHEKLSDQFTEGRAIQELEHRLSITEQDNKLLRQNYDSLLKAQHSSDENVEWNRRERELKLEIAKLNAALKGDLSDKNEILDKYSVESEAHDKLRKDFRELQVNYFSCQEQLQQAQEKLRFFTEQTGTDFTELEEALLLLRKRKQGKDDARPDFLIDVDSQSQHTSNRIVELETQLADTFAELEKTRNMLIQQHNINKTWHQEVEVATKRLSDYKNEYEGRAAEYVKRLDMREARIKKLETQLKEIAYGTKLVTIEGTGNEVEMEDDDYDETPVLALHRGQNVFEIRIQKVSLSKEAIQMLGESKPLLFVTYGFYSFQIQTTRVIRGPVAEFKMSSKFKVDMDDNFLQYLLSGKCKIELHMQSGVSYKTLAKSYMTFGKVFTSTSTLLRQNLNLIGNTNAGVEVFGTLDYSVKFVEPVEQSLRLYHERAKALSYVAASEDAEDDVPEQSAPDDVRVNQAIIKIEVAKIKTSLKTPPSLYIMYHFFDSKDDHDTKIVSKSFAPTFNDLKQFPVVMNDALDDYIKCASLSFHVFDDDRSDHEASYMGCAKVPLVELAHNKVISGNFSIHDSKGNEVGFVRIVIKWRNDYHHYNVLENGAVRLAAEREQEATENTKFEEKIRQATKPVSKPAEIVPIDDYSPSRNIITSNFDDDSSENTLIDEIVETKKSKSPPQPSKRNIVTRKVSESNSCESLSLSENTDKFKTDSSLEPVSPEVSEIPTKDNYTIADSTADLNEYLTASASDMDSEDVEVSKTLRTSASFEPEKNNIQIGVQEFSFDSKCSLWQDSSIEHIFIEYKFCEFPLEETETPISLPKPIPPNSAIFNFFKSFSFNDENDEEINAKRLLAKALNEANDYANIRFTIVSESITNADQECEEIGEATVSLLDILNKRQDLENKEIAVRSRDEDIGTLKLTVRALATLQSISNEKLVVKKSLGVTF